MATADYPTGHSLSQIYDELCAIEKEICPYGENQNLLDRLECIINYLRGHINLIPVMPLCRYANSIVEKTKHPGLSFKSPA